MRDRELAMNLSFMTLMALHGHSSIAQPLCFCHLRKLTLPGSWVQ